MEKIAIHKLLEFPPEVQLKILKALADYETKGITDFGDFWINRILSPIIEENEKIKVRNKSISEARRKAVNARWHGEEKQKVQPAAENAKKVIGFVILKK